MIDALGYLLWWVNTYFNYLVERVTALLIKAISRDIPVFTMIVFNIPKKICKGIMNVILQLWWGHDDDDDHRRMRSVAWWKMFIPKERGGMGLHDLHTFNTSMSAKQCLRLMELWYI
jgi:hypothetical protein